MTTCCCIPIRVNFTLEMHYFIISNSILICALVTRTYCPYNSQLLLAALAWSSLCEPLLRLKIFILFEICLGGTLCLGIECSR